MRLFTLICLAMFAFANAQSSMEIVKTSGNPDTVAIDAITKITFTGTDMVIGGAGRTIPLSSIQLLLFHDVNISIRAEKGKTPSPFIFQALVPNPFNPATTLRFGMASTGKVSAVIINPAGSRIKQLMDRTLDRGFYEISWNGKDESGRAVASGTYILSISVNGKTIQKQAVLLK